MGRDLRTIPVHHSLKRYVPIDMSVWGIRNTQTFFPSLEVLFKTNKLTNVSEYGIKIGEHIDSIVSAKEIRTSTGRNVPVHRKTTMILNAFKTMRGDYVSLGLPTRTDLAETITEQFQNPNAAGYVGALASTLLSESGCPHFPQVYGVYVGLSDKHTIDISDDYEDVSEKKWFADAIGTTFDLKLRGDHENELFTHTRGHRPSISTDQDICLDGIVDIHSSEQDTAAKPSHMSVMSMSEKADDATSTTEIDDESLFEIRSCSCDEDDEDDDDEDDEDEVSDVTDGDEEEPFAWATFENCPTITTIMEQCEGTLYDLFREYPDPEKHHAWFAQIIMALSFAQRTFGLVHNDLHGNNVMYVRTEQEYLKYRHLGKSYEIPTYGFLIKIIDFDRASFSVRLAGMKHPKFFISHQFHHDEEAGGQYNIEPYFNDKFPVITPSPSFDLARLATSMFWELFPEGPNVPTDHPLFAEFKEWMTGSDGKSILYRDAPKDPRHDRYHGFELYKAIARYLRDSAVPRRQLLKLGKYENTAGIGGFYIES